MGYQPGHPRNNRTQQNSRPRWKNPSTPKPRWAKQNYNPSSKVAATAQSSNQSQASVDSSPTITAHQLEQLLRMLPAPSKVPDTDDEMDFSYAGMVSCFLADSVTNAWIVDPGAIDHMCGNFNAMIDPVPSHNEPKINLPTGQTSTITHSGRIKLENGMYLNNVLHVPSLI